MTSEIRSENFKIWKDDLEERLAFFLFRYFDADNPAKSFKEAEDNIWTINQLNQK